jgi:hypothetical protein
MNRIEIELIIMQTIAKMQPTLTPRSGRDLFWFSVEGRPLTWVYLLQNQPVASVWWNTDEWRYTIPGQKLTGRENYQEDAFAAVEMYLADNALDGD